MTLTRMPEAVTAAIAGAEHIALCAHVNPDGDTVGSVLALRLGLLSLGKRVDIFCQDKIPGSLSMLKGYDAFRLPESAAEEHFDLLIAVDVSDQRRMGACESLMARADATAQIDHHGTNPAYMGINSVDPHATATALLIKQQLECLGVAIDNEMAKCLYAGLSTDSGNFAFSNVTAEAFTAMADLLAAGLPLSEMNRLLFRQREKAQVLLMNRALGSLQFYCGGRITGMLLTQRDFAECEALPEHADAIVNYGLDVVGVCMCAMARETAEGRIKFSLRAVEPARVDGIAASFGGGGHSQAAGCTLEGPIDQALARVIAAMENLLSEDQP